MKIRAACLAGMLLLAVLSISTVVAGDSAADRLYVLVSPSTEIGPSAIVGFVIDEQGIPQQQQQEVYETGGLGRADSSPQELAVDPLGRLLFACNNESQNVSVFSIAQDGALAEVARSPFPTVPLPTRLAVHPTQRILYVASSNSIGVYAIEEDGELVERQEITSPSVRDIEIDRQGNYLYATDMFFGLGVRVYGISSFGTLEELSDSPYTYPSVSRPAEVRIMTGGSRLILLDLDEGVVVFDINDWGELELVSGPSSVSGFARPITLSNRYVYVGHAFMPQIEGFGVGPDGVPITLDGAPYAAEAGVTVLLSPPRTSRLYQVNRAGSSVRPFSIGVNGALAPISEPVPVPDDRVPNGAAYLSEAKPVSSYLDVARPAVRSPHGRPGFRRPGFASPPDETDPGATVLSRPEAKLGLAR